MEMLKPITIGVILATILIFFLNSMMNSALAADTNTVSSTVVTDKSVPTANAPSVVVNNSDICKVATSGAIQTNILGLATGVVVDDELCQLLKLSRQLYASGLKVASISLLATDPRVFDSLVMAGTPPPYMGAIGSEALEKWKSNPNMIPEGSTVFEDTDVLKINVEEGVSDGEFQKFLFMAMALYIGFPILF
jgi:hypothetical protein